MEWQREIRIVKSVRKTGGTCFYAILSSWVLSTEWHKHQPDDTTILALNEDDNWQWSLSAMEDQILFTAIKKSLISILHILSHFNCQYCILTLHMHFLDRISCMPDDDLVEVETCRRNTRNICYWLQFVGSNSAHLMICSPMSSTSDMTKFTSNTYANMW